MILDEALEASTLEQFLEGVVTKKGYDAVRYSKLNESDKEQMKGNLINKVFESVKSKSLNIDYGYIKKSNGDIERLKHYDDLKDSIDMLDSLYRKDENALNDVPELQKALKNIIYYKKDFMRAFKNNNTLVIMFYNNIVAGLLYTTSVIIAEYVEHIKEANGMLTPKFKEIDKQPKGLFLNNLKSFNKMVINGKFESFLKSDGEQLTGGTLIGVSVLAVMVALWLIREIVFIFLYMRNTISDYLMQLSYFVELNSQKLSLNGNDKVVEKQEKVAEKLVKLSDKISVDSRVSTNKGLNELQRDNKELNIDDLNSVNNSDLL